MACVLGEWIGACVGLWSSGFAFEDHIRFESYGGHIVSFMQQTFRKSCGATHCECGYRVESSGGTVMAVASPNRGD